MTSEIPFKRFIFFIKINNEKKEVLSIEFNGLKLHYKKYKKINKKIMKKNTKRDPCDKRELLPSFDLFLFNLLIEEVICDGDSREDYSYKIEK